MRSATKKRTGKDPAYLEWLHSLPCLVCWLIGVAGRDVSNFPDDGMGCRAQMTPTEAAHTGPHGMSQKSDDRTAIPLCEWHHREGPESIHKLGVKFWQYHAISRQSLLDRLHEMFEDAA